MDRRLRLFRQGQRVLDLGAFPGSWSLYAGERVGLTGRVLGIDIQEPRGSFPPNVEMRQGDAFAVTPEELGGQFHVVLSDMAHSTIGARMADQARSAQLFEAALETAKRVLVPGGAFVGKLFQGPDFEALRKAMRAAFDEVRVMKPDASRSESYEIFLVGLRRKKN